VPNDYTPRLSVELSEETFRRMQDRIPWGLKSKVMVILLEDLLDLVEQHGDIVLAAIINRAVTARQVITGLDKAIKKGEISGTQGS
jgi:hypothetical protein